MAKQTKFMADLSLLGAVLALVVIGLGAFTRLTDAGLGCPDWPGCYGHMVVPQSAQALAHASAQFPGLPVVPHKAWAEMVHRYVAGSLGLLIMALAVFSLLTINRQKRLYIVPLCLVGLVLYQAVLGMWTVTLKLLPLVVAGHLLGGMLILASLWFLHLQAREAVVPEADQRIAKFKRWAWLGLVIVFLQIALGAWTSTNYAALSCADFPTCNGTLVPDLDLKDAFNFAAPIGINYEGGVLTAIARATIHFMHRLGAVITTLYLVGLCVWLYRCSTNKLLHRLAMICLSILGLQFMLGVLNVVFRLPLGIAVAHNMCAALLLCTLITLNYVLSRMSLSASKERLLYA